MQQRSNQAVCNELSLSLSRSRLCDITAKAMRDIRMAEYNAVTRYIRMCHVTPMRGIRIIGVIKRTSDIRGRKHAPSEVFAKTVIRERKWRNSGIFAAQARYPQVRYPRAKTSYRHDIRTDGGCYSAYI